MGVWGHASPENFQQMDTKENAIASYLFYPSVLLSVRCNAYEKKKGYNSDVIKEVHAKGETSSLQTGKDIDIVRKIYQLSRFND